MNSNEPQFYRTGVSPSYFPPARWPLTKTTWLSPDGEQLFDVFGRLPTVPVGADSMLVYPDDLFPASQQTAQDAAAKWAYLTERAKLARQLYHNSLEEKKQLHLKRKEREDKTKQRQMKFKKQKCSCCENNNN